MNAPLPGAAKHAPMRHARASGVEYPTGASFGVVVDQVPPGSVPLLPLEHGDQGISAAERPHAERAMSALLKKPAVNWVVTFDQETGLYELVGKTGTLRWERWKTPAGEIVYRIHSLDGENPIRSQDPTALRTFAEEVAAAGGAGKPVPESVTSYPDILQRLTQLFDSSRAPDFVYVPTGGGDLNQPGAGSHGIPDITQTRAPLIIAAPGVAQNAVTDTIVKSVDVAPTIAQLVGVKPVRGTNAAGVPKMQFLKWQDGNSVASAISDGRLGASPYGTAQRAVMFVIDGGSQSVIFDEIAHGRLPNIARIMKMGTTFRNGSIVDYPTVTWANQNTLITGASPGHQGLLNNSWYNRETGKEQLITDGGFQNLLRTGKMMNPQVETLYEAVNRSYGPDAITMAINEPGSRGATFSTLDAVGVGGVVKRLFSVVKNYLNGEKTIADHRFEKDKDYWGDSRRDVIGGALGQAYFSSANTPRLAVYEIALVDNQGHIKGPHSPESRASMQEADRNIGAMLKVLDERGLTDSTALVVTADHGMEHQYTDPAKLGGWFDALRESGEKVVESTRFVYMRNVRYDVHGATPAVGVASEIAVRVINDDVNSAGFRPAVAGSTVTLTDASGKTFSGFTDAHGVARIMVTPSVAGSLRLVIQHPAFTDERGSIPVAGAGVSAARPRNKPARPRNNRR